MINLLHKLRQPFFAHILFVSLLFVLLARNPFSSRTLIPNMEPFPDTFHYIVPAQSLLRGEGFFISREGRTIVPAVPPLYSLSLVPAFLVKNDARMFYVTNVILALTAYALFVNILRKTTDKPAIEILLSFMYVTNFYISWYPQWAMAENLMLPVVLYSILLLLQPATKKHALIAGVIPIALYGIKFANAPLVVVFLALYAIKFFKKFFILFIASVICFTTLYILGDYAISGRNLILTGWSLVLSLVKQLPMFVSSGQRGSTATQASLSPWFSLSYLPENFAMQWRGLHGYGAKFLWEQTPILSHAVAVFGWVGFGWSLLYAQRRWFSLALVLVILAETLFMSTFYSTDMRYLMFAIPFLLIGFGWAVEYSAKTLGKLFHGFSSMWLLNCLVIGITMVYLFSNALQLKSQIMVNLKYAETPWWYLAVVDMNTYFSKVETKDGKKPIVISAMPPYFIDFYSNKTYTLLPLSAQQEFRSYLVEAWGPNDYSDMMKLYATYLKNGYDIYLEEYGLGNEGYLHEAFQNVLKNFTVIKVQSGCYNVCNIYSVITKN
ncbi:MAG TPA: hypothetical protein DCX25_03960 [Candidatus Pacebacteria bacterium]|nr:MAG: hypothetical protein UX00_C0005G0050 [Microgenomates group bacterium GW2011_GWB1_45_17]KKU24815.1 MAG: hypothetical protein UX36_C0001G0432 [Microgenomates group bacterium GW2011_GWC1_46_15]HAV15461.1 hypothetical protein [Candidatus Paceibacterota bacterium]HCR11480.1 hypothetical protein [Candidatus Paceibacterota bacterium]HCR92971.1 hypothetical protein [Candidatus Paceibacterota bacterium]